jgi:hypothetical protein
MKTISQSLSARALAALRSGDHELAETTVRELISGAFSVSVAALSISRDRYSLNSVNGLVRLETGRDYFFKFHHEEGEEVTLEEYYRGELLKQAGFPVDVPEFVSRKVGSQVLLYPRRTAQRVADVAEILDFQPPAAAAPLLLAQSSLDTLTGAIYARTLHAADPALVEREPVHQLFYHRLVEPGRPQEPGGRAKRFFWDRDFNLGGTVLSAQMLREATWVINGIAYRDTIETILTRARALLEPRRLAKFGAVTAHGDSHNANVWWDEDASPDRRLTLFDPAFAGAHICALLAEVKASFHNIFAHPLWLYSAKRASERFRVAVTYRGSIIGIETDWQISALREAFLDIKSTSLWRPLLRLMREGGFLDSDWRATLRCALFCCPTLVMDLCAGGAGGHTPISSAIGIATAVSLGSETSDEKLDVITRFLNRVDPGLEANTLTDERRPR